MIPALLIAALFSLSPETVSKAFSGHPGAFVLIDCSTGQTFRNDPAACSNKLAPCSTFKIWNSAIGMETGVIAGPDSLLWKWDGVERSLVKEWNQDQTLQTAFTFSCVPAYQDLARKIGQEQMKTWIDKIGYGDRNISSGLDLFWLPAEGRQTLLISADEQAELIARLVSGKLPFSKSTTAKLKELMKLKSTAKGILYGKTGTSVNEKGEYIFGWFVGYVESGGKTYAFACRLEGKGLMGKDARAAAETILSAEGLL